MSRSGAVLYEREITIIKALPKLGDDNYLDYVAMLSQKDVNILPYLTPDGQKSLIASKSIEKIMADVENENISKKYSNVKDIPYEKPGDYWRVLCLQFNSFVKQVGVVSKELHYFRIKLNRCPKTLDEMKTKTDWILLDVKDSQFHMLRSDFSDSGLRNLKFTCRDGIFEAVYNHKGYLCDDVTDATNMGTYNYASPKNVGDHANLDVLPYYSFGNIEGVAATLSPDSAYRYDYRYSSLEFYNSTQEKKAEMANIVYESQQAHKYRGEFVEEWDKAGE